MLPHFPLAHGYCVSQSCGQMGSIETEARVYSMVEAETTLTSLPHDCSLVNAYV